MKIMKCMVYHVKNPEPELHAPEVGLSPHSAPGACNVILQPGFVLQVIQTFNDTP